MGLQIRRRSSIKLRVATTVIAVMALAVQPVYSFVSYQVAHAVGCSAPDSSVVINEIYSNPSAGNSEWVELYNRDASSCVDISQWSIKSGSSEFAKIGKNTTVAANGFYTIEATTGVNLSNSGQTLHLLPQTGSTDVDTVLYPALSTGESYGRSPDGSSDLVTFSAADVTKNTSNYVAPTPDLVAQDFDTWDDSPSFKGFNVGFAADNFGTVTSATVEVTRADGSIVTKTAGPDMLAYLSDKTALTQASAPFVIEPGTTDGLTGDSWWSAQTNVAWTSATEPTSVKITVTGDNGTESVTNSTFLEGDISAHPSYASMLPADVTGPTITIANPSTPVVSNARDLVLSGTVSDPSGVLDLYVRANDAAVRPSRVFTGTATLNGSNWTLTVPAGTFEDGHTIQLQVFARDNLHNQSEKDVTFAVDNSAPAVPSDLNWVGSNNKGASNGFTNVQKGTLSWKDTTPSDVDHYVYKFWTNIPGYWNDPSHPWTDSYSYVKKTADGGYVPTDFANKEGTYYFCVAAVDAAGNDSGCSSTTAITYDITAPTNIAATYTGGLKNVTIPTSVTGAVVGGDLTFQVSEVEQNPSNMYAEINWLNPATNKWEKHAGWGETITSDSGTLSLPATAPSGQYQIKISSIRDAAGNTAPTQTFGFTVDNTSPVAPTITPVGGADIKGDQIFTVTESNSGDLLSVVSSAGTLVDNHDGTYSLDTTAMTKDTKVTITATETDAAGNNTVVTATYSVENAAPTVSGITMGHDANGQYWLTGSSTNSAGSEVSVLTNGTLFAGPIAVNADGSWTIPLGALPKSTSYNFTIAIANMLGYSSLLTQTFTTAPLQTALVRPSVTQSLLRSFATVATPVNTATSPAPVVKDNSNKGILGAQTTKSDKNVSDTSVLSPSSQGWKILGFAWYWWLVLIAAIVAFWYWLAAVRRRHADEAAYLNK